MTPPSTTSSHSGGHSPNTDFRVVRKRNRVPLSCGPCRHRKLKCNRTNPCENCIRRGDASSCSYATPGSRKKNQSQGATSPDDMQNRIDRLEGLVLSLMTNGAQSAGPTAAAAAISRSQSDSTGSSSYPLDVDRDDDDMIKEEDDGEESDLEDVTNSLGVLKVDADKGKSIFFGDSHWHLVLADIAEVKSYFVSHKKDMEKNYEKIRSAEPSNSIEGPVFLFNPYQPVTDSELRAELPSKSSVDKLVSRYFNSYDPAVHIIHAPTFHARLNRHWQDPSNTSIVWLGLLYSILSLAMLSYNKIGDEPIEWKGRTLELAAEYRLRTVQCLVNSDYTKSTIYTIETLILYIHGEYSSRWDAEVGIWVIVGMIVRLAMRMGYHRDASNFSGVTPYQGEMRRRIWAFVRQLDTMFSFQLALPGMIRSNDCDSAPPRNIFEDEFGPDSTVLPPSRPLSEPTPVSYMITKYSISLEFASILETVNAVSGKSIGYDEVLKQDARLRDVRSNFPPHLKLVPMDECPLDPATLLMQRFTLDILWQKSMCVLHRKYIARARFNQKYAHSRRACVDSAMEILRHQTKLDQEAKPGGRMHTMKWFISSLTKHDYLLAAMIVCLDLHYDSVSESSAECPMTYDRHFWTPAQRRDMLIALETSQKIWKEGAEKSMEAYKASNILSIMLEKIKLPMAPTRQDATSTAETFAQFDQSTLRPEQTAAMTLGMLSSGLSPNSAAMFNSMGQSPRGTLYQGYDMPMGDGPTGLTPNFTVDAPNPFDNMASPFSVFGNTGAATSFDMPATLDWAAWDSYIQNGSAIDPNFQFYPGSNEQSLSPISPQQTQQMQQNQQDQQGQQNQQSQQNQPMGGTNYQDNVFMGANTPGR